MARDVELGIRLTADAKGFRGTLRIAGKDLEKLGGAGRQAAKGVDATGAAARKAEGGLRGFASRLKAAHGRMALYVGGAGVVALVSKAFQQLSRFVVGSGLAMERWQSQLRFATGSTQGAAREIGYLRREAERLGLDFSSLADGFAGFAAATRGTALEGEKTRDVFTAVAEAASVMRLSAADTQGVLTALTQIVSKGVVSAEELRQQLGERLAGAFQIAALSMGYTTEELGKQLALGNVLMEDFLPKFAAEARRTYGAEVPNAAKSATAEFNRLGNAMEELGQAVAESGVLDFLAKMAKLGAEAVRALSGADEELFAVDVRDVAALRQAVEDRKAELPSTKQGRTGQTAEQRQARDPELQRLIRLLPEKIDEYIDTLEEDVAAAAKNLGEQTGGHARRSAQNRLREAKKTYADTVALQLERDIVRSAGHGSELDALIDELAGDLKEPKPEDQPKDEPAGQSQAEALVAAYRRSVEQEEQRDFTHAQRAEAEIARLAADPEAALDATQSAEVRELAAALDDAAAAREKAEQAAADQALAEEAATEALSLYGEALDQTTHLEHAEALVREANNKLSDDTKAAIIEVARAKDEEAASTARLNAELAEERRLRESRDLADGAKRALNDYGEAATDAASNIEGALVGAFQGAETALTDFLLTGEADFGQFVDSLIADLARLVIRQQILGPLAKALGGAIGGDTVTAQVPHAGGVAGAVPRTRQVPAGVFGGPIVPRYHRGGVVGDEVPAILQRGEHVLTAEQARARQSPTVIVNIVNESGAQLQATGTETEFDGEDVIVNVVVQDIQNGGPIGRAIGTADRQR